VVGSPLRFVRHTRRRIRRGHLPTGARHVLSSGNRAGGSQAGTGSCQRCRLPAPGRRQTVRCSRPHRVARTRLSALRRGSLSKDIHSGEADDAAHSPEEKEIGLQVGLVDQRALGRVIDEGFIEIASRSQGTGSRVGDHRRTHRVAVLRVRRKGRSPPRTASSSARALISGSSALGGAVGIGGWSKSRSDP